MTDDNARMTPEEAQRLGENFKLYRRFKGITLRDLGNAIGLSVNTIRQHEAGARLFRADDMVNVRGVNVYPAAIESVVRRFPEVVEFRSTVRESGAMRSLSVEIELRAPAPNAPATATQVSRRLREALGLSVPVHVVEPGTLPRFEMKARRFVVEERG